MKLKHVLGIVLLLLIIDQVLKIYVKLNFTIGESVHVLGSWFQLNFIENSGMAFGMEFGKKWGKLFLTLFRMIAVIWGIYFIQKELIKKRYHKGLIIASSFILAGALGNLIDSLIYGKIFSASSFHTKSQFVPWGQGYTDFFYGDVVDMLYFPLFRFRLPDWIPYRGGTDFEFFRPIFNVADSCIFIGVVLILLFQKRWVRKNAW